MKLLIVFATNEGQTKKIADYLSQHASKRDHQVITHNASGGDLFPGGFDAVILMGSIHVGKFQLELKEYINTYVDTLNTMPNIFISVSLSAANDDPHSWNELKQITDDFLSETGWGPTGIEHIAGALRYTQYNFLKKWLMKMVAKRNGGATDTSKDYEYTDWNKVDQIIPKLEEFIQLRNKTLQSSPTHSPTPSN